MEWSEGPYFGRAWHRGCGGVGPDRLEQLLRSQQRRPAHLQRPRPAPPGNAKALTETIRTFNTQTFGFENIMGPKLVPILKLKIGKRDPEFEKCWTDPWGYHPDRGAWTVAAGLGRPVHEEGWAKVPTARARRRCVSAQHILCS